ncbi:voltage-gated delayed rectifier potassium channel KCNH8 isoform X2 [Parasteatoda tepidariorum]|uniref:voltage-gated delayed rectifier potassium channel KCNH8 isoform X2 n=1 Tax=Parasteatoda tepidariorum TaxID=114398 RepID=UPI00077FCCE2|nr:potassium voltage-gated channel subfamily H member 8-like [Parasteatoda tepidariorum]
MPVRKGLLAPQNNFLDTIATRFDGSHSNFVLGNAQVPHLYPIVYCSDGFCDLTGFPRAQIMQKGSACTFLYGPETKDELKQEIDDALDKKMEYKLEIMLYKKGATTPFWCLLDIVPIKNEKHENVLFLVSTKDVTKNKMAEMELDDEGEDNETENHLDIEGCLPSNHYQRRRSRAVLYQLSGHYKQDKIKSKLKLNNNLLHRPAVMPEYKAESIEKSRFILSHYGLFKTCWDWLILIGTFYVAIVVPYSATFRDTGEAPLFNKTIITDVIMESIFIIDILLNFRTTYVNKEGKVVADPHSIAINYLRGWFVVDLLAALPFDLLYACNLYSRNTLMHLFKLTRLLRLARLVQKVDRYSQHSSIILTLLMLFFSLVAHWMACIWYVIALAEIDANPSTWDVGWLNQLSIKLGFASVNETDITTAYITALYFTTTSLTSVGFGNVAANTNAEKVFSILTMLIGALMHAVVFGNVTAIIQRMYARRSQYHTKLRDLKDFFRLHQIPKELKQRMTDYFQTIWSLNHGIDPNEILREFPDELRGDASMHLHKEILSLPVFDHAPQGCLKLLSRHVRSNFCAPGEYLVHMGDALTNIHFVCNGSMEVLQNNMVVAILGKGDLVGCDISVTGPEHVLKSSSDVKALTYCDLKSIHIPGLMEVLKLYPEFSETFCNDILHDLTFNLREGYETEDSNGMASMTLPSISEDDENNDSDGTAPASPMSPCLTINRNKYGTGDENWESKVHQFRRTFQGHRPTVRFEKLRPAATHPNLRRSWDNFDIRDEIELTKNSVERLDSQMTTLTQDVASLSQEVRLILALLTEKYESRVALPPQISQSCESLPSRQCPTNTFLPRRASSQPLRLPSTGSRQGGEIEEKLSPSTVESETQTDWYLLDDILNRRCPTTIRNSGCPCSPQSEERVKFLIGPSTSVREDEGYNSTPQSIWSKETSPHDSGGSGTHNIRMAAFWSSADSETSVPSSSRYRSSMNGSRDSTARNDVPEHIIEIDGSTSIRRKLSTEL